jgi:hypothetical protein
MAANTSTGGRSNSAVDKTKFNVDRTMFGQVPTIIPGRMWPDRLYCSEEACHCPPVRRMQRAGLAACMNGVGHSVWFCALVESSLQEVVPGLRKHHNRCGRHVAFIVSGSRTYSPNACLTPRSGASLVKRDGAALALSCRESTLRMWITATSSGTQVCVKGRLR